MRCQFAEEREMCYGPSAQNTDRKSQRRKARSLLDEFITEFRIYREPPPPTKE